MRAFVALLIVVTAVASADAQQAPVVTGPSVAQGQAGTAGSAWRGYSRGSYSRSPATTRPAYSQPTRRGPSQYQRSTWRPRATYYSNRGYSQQPMPQSAPAIQAPGVPAPFGYPQAGGQPQVQQPVIDNAPKTTAKQPKQELSEDEKQELARKAREEQWRQFQIQEAQRQAYYQRYGDPATQRFWQDIYSYNRSFHNQNMHGYSFHGQNTIGQNMYGYSNYNQSWAGQSYTQPSFHLQSRFNQSPPIYNFHNIIMPGAGNWRY